MNIRIFSSPSRLHRTCNFLYQVSQLTDLMARNSGVKEPLKVKNHRACQECSLSHVSDSLRPRGLYTTRLLCPWGSSRQEYWSGLPRPPPGNLPDPGIKPRSPALQADSLLSEPPEKATVQSILISYFFNTNT